MTWAGMPQLRSRGRTLNYRLVYDVLDDSPFAGRGMGLIFLGFALAWTALWVVIHRCVRGMPEERRRKWWVGLVVGSVFATVGVIGICTETWPAYREQRRCREWARSGKHETTEGRIADFQRESGRNAWRRFQIGEVRFAFRGEQPATGGFRGTFTAEGTDELTLKDGLAVRIAYRDERILRIEIAE